MRPSMRLVVTVGLAVGLLVSAGPAQGQAIDNPTPNDVISTTAVPLVMTARPSGRILGITADMPCIEIITTIVNGPQIQAPCGVMVLAELAAMDAADAGLLVP